MNEIKIKNKCSKKHTHSFNLINILGLFFTIPVISALAVFITGFFPLKHPKIKSYIHSQLKLSGLDAESLNDAHIILWKGISLHGLVVSSKIDDESNCKCVFESIFINCNVIKVFFKWNRCKKDNFHISDNYYFENPVNENINELILRFNELFDYGASIDISGSDLLFLKNDSSVFKATNISGKIDFDKSNASSFKSSYAIDSFNLLLFNKRLTSISCSLLYEKGNVIISECNAKFKHGSVDFAGTVDIGKTRIKRLNVKGYNIDISEFYEKSSINGSMNGVAGFELTFGSSPFVFDSLNMEGSIKTSLLKISNLPLQRTFMDLMSTDKMKHLCFEHTETTFKKMPEESKYEINMTANGNQINFVSKGWFSTDGILDQKIEGIINETFASELPQMIAGALKKKDSGRFFKCKLYGTIYDPKIELDRDILRKAVKNMFINIKMNLKDKFHNKNQQ